MRVLALAAFVATGCLGAETVECPTGGVCPSGTECRVDRGALLCVSELCGNGTLEPGEQCDDGNPTSGDGCQATCRITARPPARMGAAMVYSPSWKKLVVFGGHSGLGGTVLGDTWEWDGLDWYEREPPTTSPPPRYGAAITFDTWRQRLYMFGGVDAGGFPLGDFWMWDDTGWYEVRSAISPWAVGGASMTFDNARGVAVLVGGRGADQWAEDTWEWNGQEWTIARPSPSPRFVGSAAMTFDDSRGASLLVGGTIDQAAWQWDGTRWATTGAVAPGQFQQAAMAYDQIRNAAVFFGGATYPGFDAYGGTWELTDAGWIERTPIEAPPPRRSSGMTFDGHLGGVLLFGGMGPDGTTYGDLWSWDGTTWREHL